MKEMDEMTEEDYRQARKENCYHRKYFVQWNIEDDRTKRMCSRCGVELEREGVVLCKQTN